MWQKGFFTTTDAKSQSCDAQRLLDRPLCIDGFGKPTKPEALNVYVLTFGGAECLAWLCDKHRIAADAMSGANTRKPTTEDMDRLMPRPKLPPDAYQPMLFPEVLAVKKGRKGKVHA